MPLRLLTTGGTFDKHYDPLTGQLVFADAHLPQCLAQARFDSPPVVQALMAIDSLEMTDHHRQQILAACRDSPERRIVIIHGTDTLVDTAAVLGSARLEATIVLTGAMVPAEIEGSDALFNLGFAAACAATLAHGVWVAMNARVFDWRDVRKNRALGRFEPITPTMP